MTDGVEAAPGEGGPAASGAIRLDQAATDLLLPEIEAVLAGLTGAAARERFVALQQDLQSGSVSAACHHALEQLLQLGIETGRFERVHGRAADTLARGLYARTPAGRDAATQAATVSGALQAFAGAVVHGISVAADGPGGYRVTLETDRGEALLRVDRDGVRIDSVAV